MKAVFVTVGMVTGALSLLAMGLNADLLAKGMCDVTGLPQWAGYFFAMLLTCGMSAGQVGKIVERYSEEASGVPTTAVVITAVVTAVTWIWTPISAADGRIGIHEMAGIGVGLMLVTMIVSGLSLTGWFILLADRLPRRLLISLPESTVAPTSSDVAESVVEPVVKPLKEETLFRQLDRALLDSVEKALGASLKGMPSVAGPAPPVVTEPRLVEDSADEKLVPAPAPVIASGESVSITMSDEGMVVVTARAGSRNKMKELRTALTRAVPNVVDWEKSVEHVGNQVFVISGQLRRKARKDMVLKQLEAFVKAVPTG